MWWCFGRAPIRIGRRICCMLGTDKFRWRPTDVALDRYDGVRAVITATEFFPLPGYCCCCPLAQIYCTNIVAFSGGLGAHKSTNIAIAIAQPAIYILHFASAFRFVSFAVWSFANTTCCVRTICSVRRLLHGMAATAAIDRTKVWTPDGRIYILCNRSGGHMCVNVCVCGRTPGDLIEICNFSQA